MSEDAGTADPHHYAASTLPGARAPHKWLPDGRSTLDLFTRSFVLMHRGPASVNEQAMRAAALSRGVPLSSHEIDDTVAGTEYHAGWTLVRPDGHVAWRGDPTPEPPERLLDLVTGQESSSERTCFDTRTRERRT